MSSSLLGFLSPKGPPKIDLKIPNSMGFSISNGFSLKLQIDNELWFLMANWVYIIC